MKAAIKQNPLKGRERMEVGELALDMQGESFSKKAAGTNAGSHSNCNLIIVFWFSSCTGLKKMTRCAFWKSPSLCCLGNNSAFHTSERRVAQNLSVWFAPREARTPSWRLVRNLRASLVSLQTLKPQKPGDLGSSDANAPFPLLKIPAPLCPDWQDG